MTVLLTLRGGYGLGKTTCTISISNNYHIFTAANANIGILQQNHMYVTAIKLEDVSTGMIQMGLSRSTSKEESAAQMEQDFPQMTGLCISQILMGWLVFNEMSQSQVLTCLL